MEIAPLIHSRTFYKDFNPNFAVRPEDIDVRWAMKKILQSTSDIDLLENGIRFLTAYNNKQQIGIFGIACNFKRFIEDYVKDDEILQEAQKYFYDEKHSTAIKVFIGYAFKGDGVPEILYENFYINLWNIFKKHIIPQWKSETTTTELVNYTSCDTVSPNEKEKPFDNIDNIDFYITSKDLDIKIFKQCISERKNFCSNVDQYKIISSGEFNVIATSKNYISKFKNEQTKKKPQKITQKPILPTKKLNAQVPHPNKNNRLERLIISTLILLILLLVAYIINNNSKDSTDHQTYNITLTNTILWT